MFRNNLILLVALASLLCAHADEKQRETPNMGTVRPLQKIILAEIPDGWEVSRCPSQLVLTLRNVSFLNSIGQPLVAEGDIWQNDSHSWTADYRITISETSALTQQEYDALIAAREELLRVRAERTPEYTKRHRAQDEEFVQTIIPLPVCQIGESSIWISANDALGRHWVRPETANELFKRLIDVLKNNGTIYKPAQQPADGKTPEATQSPR